VVRYADLKKTDTGNTPKVGLVGNASGLGGSAMDYAVKEIAPQVWARRHCRCCPHYSIPAWQRDVRAVGHLHCRRPQALGIHSLESAFRWIEARTGHPVEAFLAEGLLEETAPNRSLETPKAQKASPNMKSQGRISPTFAGPKLADRLVRPAVGWRVRVRPHERRITRHRRDGRRVRAS